MEPKEPSYYSIIPAPVRYDKRLTPSAKILYAEITSLTNKVGFCYSSNRYFQDLYQVSKQSINSWLKQLEEYGYISRHIYRSRGSQEILNRYITIFEKPIQEILTDNNTSINTKLNNYLKKKPKINKKQHIRDRRKPIT
ncbi:helix-turn-helix domain-containing protein [Cellulophaga fucicola]|uniref:helix-turn-helix domain-containing protein n=1 Tax=Cellulophaga fucicola TaxID=76595 RepID=UPI003EBBE22F